MDVDTLPNHVNLYILMFSFFGFYHNCCTNHNITKFLLDILSDLLVFMDVDTLPNHVNLYILLFSFFGFYHNCCTNHNITKFLLDILSDLPYMTKIPKPFLSEMVSFCTFICILDNSCHKLGTSLVCSGWYSQVVQTFISYRMLLSVLPFFFTSQV